MRAVVILLVLALVSGCATMRRVSGSGNDAEAAANRLQELQLKVMRFADEYAGGVIESTRQFQVQAADPKARLVAQEWKLSQATSAYSIASGPNPVTNALDLVVLATLSRMVTEDSWVQEQYGERALPVRDAHRSLEPQAWTLAAEALTQTQIQQLHGIINEWRAQHPHVRAVSYVHFRGFAKSIGHPKEGEAQPLGGLFSILGIDPLSGLDPAVRELAQTRQLAERTIYYAQRAPSLIDMEAERLTYVFAAMPETREMLAATDRASRAAEAAGNLADQVPQIVANERQAAIHQVMQELAAQQKQMLALVTELRGALEAGTTMSASVQGTLQDLDAFIGQFRAKRAGAAAAAQAPDIKKRPFDVTEYAATARELGSAARELNALVSQLDASTPQVRALADQTTLRVRAVIDFAFWRLSALIVLAGVVVFLAVVALRFVRKPDTARSAHG